MRTGTGRLVRLLRSRRGALVGLLVVAMVAAGGTALALTAGGGRPTATGPSGSVASSPVGAPLLPVSPTSPTTTAPTMSAPTVAPVVAVRPLTSLVVPDLLVLGSRTVSPAQLAALRAIPGVTSVVPLAVGPVHLPGGAVTAVGGDPSVLRTITPAPTAQSDPLWASVARGELLSTFATAAAQHLTLGATISANARPVRLGSIADLRMPGVGALADASLAAGLKLVPDAGLVVTGASLDITHLDKSVRAVLGKAPVTVSFLRPFVPAVAGTATLTVPLYKAAAATCPGLSWTVLAAIGGIESDHGADTATSPAGAVGPMQFLPSTFARVAVDGDHDGKTIITDPADAVFSAAKLLCQDGAGQGGTHLYGAIFSYNHADWYVDAVEQLAHTYATA